MSKTARFILVTLLMFLSLTIVGSLGFLGYKYYQEMGSDSDADNETDEQEDDSNAGGEEYDYSGWLSYTNEIVGYSLKYPADWTYEETSGISQILETEINYTEFTTPLGTLLHLGLKKNDAEFGIADRTGIGAGEDILIPEKEGVILGNSITPKAHTWENMVSEYFFNVEDTCSCIVSIWFTLEEEIPLEDAKINEELDTLNQLFASIEWVEIEQDEALGIEKSIEAVEGYLEARMNRNLTEAKPFMTDYLYDQFDQGSFAGTSSPSIGGYSNVNSEYVELGDLYLVTADIDWYLQGEKVDTSEWEFQVVVEGNEYLVNQVDME